MRPTSNSFPQADSAAQRFTTIIKIAIRIAINHLPTIGDNPLFSKILPITPFDPIFYRGTGRYPYANINRINILQKAQKKITKPSPDPHAPNLAPLPARI
jgi:hypothetical protein